MIDKDQRSLADSVLKLLSTIKKDSAGNPVEQRLVQVSQLRGEKSTTIFGGRYCIELGWKGKISSKVPVGTQTSRVPLCLETANDAFGLLESTQYYALPERNLSIDALVPVTIYEHEGNSLHVFKDIRTYDHIVTRGRNMYFVNGPVLYNAQPVVMPSHVWKNSVVNLPGTIFMVDVEVKDVIGELLTRDEDFKYNFQFTVTETTVAGNKYAVLHIFSDKLKWCLHLIPSLPFGGRQDQIGEILIGGNKITKERKGVLLVNIEDFAKLTGGIQRPAQEVVQESQTVTEHVDKAADTPPFPVDIVATAVASEYVAQDTSTPHTVAKAQPPAVANTVTAEKPQVSENETETTAKEAHATEQQEPERELEALELIAEYRSGLASIQLIEKENAKILKKLESRCRADKKSAKDSGEAAKLREQLASAQAELKKLRDENKAFRTAMAAFNKAFGGGDGQ